MRPRVQKLLLAGGSALATLCVVDATLWFLQGPVRPIENFYEPDPRYGYRMRPHLEFTFANSERGYSATVRTNSGGLRDDEVFVPKPSGTFRILLLGDSMTAGLEVDKSQTFEAVCEALLGAHGPVEVLNCGVRGYNLDNIFGFLRAEGIRYQPDVAVYVFVDNDLQPYDTFMPAAVDRSRGRTFHGALARLATYSHVLYRVELLRETCAMRCKRKRDPRDFVTEGVSRGILSLCSGGPFAGDRLCEGTDARIAQMDAWCRERGIQLLLAGAPHREEIDPRAQAWWSRWAAAHERQLDFDGVRRYLDWVAARHDVERFDPVPDFRAHLAQIKSYWFHKDGHLNAPGHRLLGELLARRIEQLPRFRAWQMAHRHAATSSTPARMTGPG